MLQKNLPVDQVFTTMFIRLWLDLIALIKFVFDRKFKDAWAVSRAHQSFFLNFFKNAKKRNNYAGIENKAGQYKKSIIADYYLDKKQKFSDLDQDSFF
ncbi:hypothetical protein D3C87_1541600 [compost metagenome]